MAFLPAIGAALAGFFGTTGVAATAGAVATTALAGASLVNAFSGTEAPGVSESPKPATPSPQASLVDASIQANKRRRETLLAGGMTNPTGGSGSLIKPSNVQKKTLFGQ